MNFIQFGEYRKVQETELAGNFIIARVNGKYDPGSVYIYACIISYNFLCLNCFYRNSAICPDFV